MIVTSIEALRMRCSNGGTVEEAGVLPGVLVQKPSLCGADRCMAWRWVGGSGQARETARGYCGLAGLPGTQVDLAHLADVATQYPAVYSPLLPEDGCR